MYGVFKTIVVELLEPDSSSELARVTVREPPSLAATYEGQVISVGRDRLKPFSSPGFATIKPEDLAEAT